MEKKKTYVLMLSEFFPKTHNKAGMPTEFKEKVLNKKKIHTIRANFPLWEKRIKEVQEGRAVLSIRQWTGEPYRSKQVEKNEWELKVAWVFRNFAFLIA